MSKEGPGDLSALDSLFSRHGQGTSSGGKDLSASRKQQILTGQTEEPVDATHETLKALINYEETIPDREVDEFVSKIKDTRLLDDYDEEHHSVDHLSNPHSPALNPWPLDEDILSPVMADPLSGDIVVTDLSSTRDPKEPRAEDALAELEGEKEEINEGNMNGSLASSGDAEDALAADSSSSDDDGDEEAEDLTEEFKAAEEEERGAEGDESGNVTADHGDDVEITKGKEEGEIEESEDWELIPRVDDDVDGEGAKECLTEEAQHKDNLIETTEKKEENEDEEEVEEVEEVEVEEEEEDEDKDNVMEEKEEEMEEKEESKEVDVEDGDVTVSSEEGIVNDGFSSTDGSPQEDMDSQKEPNEKALVTSDVTEADGQSSAGEKNHATLRIQVEPAESSHKDDIPDFETFLAEMGVSTLDVEAQKSRARLSRVGPMAARRPITKRFSAGEDVKQDWMFMDSTDPKLKRSSIQEDEEEEEEKTRRAAPPTMSAKPPMGGRSPLGAMGMAGIRLPGIGAAIGGVTLRKTPTGSPNKTFHSPGEDSKTKATPSPSLQTSPRKVLPTVPAKTPPKPASRPKPQPRLAPTAQEPVQASWVKEFKQRSPKKSSSSEVKSLSEVEAEKKEKGLNSDILHPAPSGERDPEPNKTPSWLANSKTKKLPPIGSPKKAEESSPAPSVPLWKQEMLKKKKPAVTPPPSGANKSPSKPPPKPLAKPVVSKKPSPAKQPDKKREESRNSGLDETDSKKIKLSPSAQASVPEETMDVEISTPAPKDETPAPKDETPAPKDESPAPKDESPAPKDETAEPKNEKQGDAETTKNDESSKEEEKKLQLEKEAKMDEEEEEEIEVNIPGKEETEEEEGEEVKSVKTQEINVKVVRKTEAKKEEVVSPPPIKQEELKVKIVPKSKELSESREGEKENIGVSIEAGKSDRKPVKPGDKPRLAEKPKPAERPKFVEKPVKIIPKSSLKKEESTREKPEEKKVTIVRKSDTVNKSAEKSDPVHAKNTANKEGTHERREKESDSALSNMPKWKREALERKQKRKMSGGYAPIQKASMKETIENNNTPQWKKDLMEKRRHIPKMPSMDSVEKEEKGSKDPLTSEKKRHTIAADVQVSLPVGHKTGTPTWKQELEQRKNARLAKHLEIKDAEREQN